MKRFFVEMAKPGVVAAFYSLDGNDVREHVHGEWSHRSYHNRDFIVTKLATGVLREIPAMPDSMIVRVVHVVAVEAFEPWLTDPRCTKDPAAHFAVVPEGYRCNADVQVVSHVAYAAPFPAHVVRTTHTSLSNLHRGVFGRDVSTVAFSTMPPARKHLDTHLGSATTFEGAPRASDHVWLASRCIEYARDATARLEAEERARRVREKREREEKEREERAREERERKAREREQKAREEREAAAAAAAARGELTDVTDDDLRALLRKRRAAKTTTTTTNEGG